MATAPSFSRRSFLRAQVAAEPAALRPPWTSSERLLACTACGDCIAACPQAILSPGRDGLPVLSFAARACTLCGRCADVCAEPVFTDRRGPAFRHVAAIDRSEEDTSELQSLMRISYAVFCLNKKKQHRLNTTHTITT